MTARIHNIGSLRRLVMPLLKATSMDITIRHHWVPDAKISLNSFRHKGYWYHGQSREAGTMRLFSAIVRDGSRVIEVGGHIGYISLYLSHLAGPSGVVDVFEPGSNNLPYIRRNVGRYAAAAGRRINLIECAVGPTSGLATLYEDGLTGQNNSLVRDFETLQNNARAAHVQAPVLAREVEVRSLDQHVGLERVDLVKIDVEGFEWGVIQGMSGVLARQKPVIMVELTKSIPEIHACLTAAGYRMFRPDGVEVLGAEGLKDNTFAMHDAAHAQLIAACISRG